MLELWWLGQAGFRLRDTASGTTVFCDPFLSSHDDRTWPAPIDARGLGQQADVILVSHEHIDHFDRPTLREAASDSRFTLVVPLPLVEEARGLGLTEGRVIGAQPDQVLDPAGVRIMPVPACHGVNIEDAYNFGEQLSGGLTRYLGYVVDIGGQRIYHAGDCIPYAHQVERLRRLRPSVALLPINGRDFFRERENIVGNMDHREAAQVASGMGAQVVIPIHWELFPRNRGYPGELASYASEHFPDLTVLVMGRGARLTLPAPTNR